MVEGPNKEVSVNNTQDCHFHFVQMAIPV